MCLNIRNIRKVRKEKEKKQKERKKEITPSCDKVVPDYNRDDSLQEVEDGFRGDEKAGDDFR